MTKSKQLSWCWVGKYIAHFFLQATIRNGLDRHNYELWRRSNTLEYLDQLWGKGRRRDLSSVANWQWYALSHHPRRRGRRVGKFRVRRAWPQPATILCHWRCRKRSPSGTFSRGNTYFSDIAWRVLLTIPLICVSFVSHCSASHLIM